MGKSSLPFGYKPFLVFIGPLIVLLMYLFYFFVFTQYHDTEPLFTFNQLFIIFFVLVCAWNFIFVYLMASFERKS